MNGDSINAKVFEEEGVGFGEGEEKLSEESFSSPSPNPTLSSSKTFVFIESLFRVFNMLKDEVLFFFRPQ